MQKKIAKCLVSPEAAITCAQPFLFRVCFLLIILRALNSLIPNTLKTRLDSVYLVIRLIALTLVVSHIQLQGRLM